jgi:DNA-binding NarL/FixJ family response regulator/Ca2+-binding EF-hand superfamily protein
MVNTSARWQIVLVEGHTLWRDLLVRILCLDSRFELVADLGDAEQAKEVCLRTEPDLLITAVELPHGDGIELARYVLDRLPHTRILVVSPATDPLTLNRLAEIGVHGFVEHDQSFEILEEAMAEVASGKTYFRASLFRNQQRLRSDPSFTLSVHSDWQLLSAKPRKVRGLTARLREANCVRPWRSDANKDGTVSAAEITAASESMAKDSQADFLDKYDANDDGTVTTAEALAVNQAAAEDWLKHLLDRFDKNDDGALSASELRRYGRGLDRFLLLDSYDKNDDGALSSAELVAAATAIAQDLQAELLAEYDTDKDGSITSAESLAVAQSQAKTKIQDLLDTYDGRRRHGDQCRSQHGADGKGWFPRPGRSSLSLWQGRLVRRDPGSARLTRQRFGIALRCCGCDLPGWS